MLGRAAALAIALIGLPLLGLGGALAQDGTPAAQVSGEVKFMAYAGEFLVTGPDKRGDMAKYEEKIVKARGAGENFVRGLDAHVD